MRARKGSVPWSLLLAVIEHDKVMPVAVGGIRAGCHQMRIRDADEMVFNDPS